MATEQEQNAVVKALAGAQRLVVFDIGAHQGEEYHWMKARLAPDLKYVAVEADPRSEEALRKIEGIDFLPCAVADRAGVFDFFLCDNTAGQAKGSSSLRMPTGHLKYFPWCTFENRVPVVSLTLDQIAHEFPVIDMLWVDIQGGERDMIAGGTETLKRARFIMIEAEEVEMYSGQATKPELLAMLPDFEVVEDFGYNVFLKRKEAA